MIVDSLLNLFTIGVSTGNARRQTIFRGKKKQENDALLIVEMTNEGDLTSAEQQRNFVSYEKNSG